MREKFLTIQYLRGLAAALVLASHALLYPLVEPDLGFGRLGWLGVILFFVISGFIMVTVTGESRFSARDFLRRRFIRVVPMYWAATLIAALLALAVPHLFKTTVYDTGEVVLSLLFIPFYNPASGGIHPLYKLGWTLNYEVFFYLSFALLAFLSARARVIGLTAAFGALALMGWLFDPEPAIARFYTNVIPLAFCAGAWLALWTRDGSLRRLPRRLVWLLLVAGLLGLLEGFAVDRGAVEDSLAFFGLAAFASMIIMLAVRWEPKLPRFAALELIGDASYSIYLIHIYEVAALAGLAYKLLDPTNPVAVYGVTAISITGGIGAGIIVYRYIEQPLLRMMSDWLRPRPILAQATPRNSSAGGPALGANAVDHGHEPVGALRGQMLAQPQIIE